MARKKITALVGKDTEYSKQFGDTPAPNDASKPKVTTPPEVPQPTPAEAKQASAPAPASPGPAKTPLKADTKPTIDETPKKAATTQPKRTSTRKPSPPVAPKPSGQTRAVHVRATPRADQRPGLDKLENVGLPAADVVRLAGKRAMDKMILVPKYAPPEKVERLSTDFSFRTMKTLDAAVLDALRDEADPLRLRSDASVIQGQLEPVFWTELDAVIKELSKRFS